MQPGQQLGQARRGRRRHPLYPPRQLPPHPQLQTRRRVGWLPVVLIATAVIVAAVVVAGPHGQRTPYVNSPYAPQPQRSAEVVGNPDGPLSQQAIDDIAQFNSYEVLPKFADHYDITDHFEETRQLVDAAKKYGNDLKVFDYFSASYWFNANDRGWGRYASGFQQAWLLRDSTGATIPFLGAGGGATSASTDQKGYLIDLSNPNYRAWAVATIVDWMRAAPYAGISLDSATPMVGDEPSHAIADGTRTYNALLCGPTLTSSTTDCPRVLAWNQGLIDLLAQTSSALHAMHDEVRYNGIAPSQLRGVSRNVGLLHYTDMASDEGFCMAVSVNDPSRVVFNSFVNDAALMREIAAQHKKVTEITNTYGSDTRNAYSRYCLAGFLIGWQPGSSYFTFHAGYSVPPGGTYPDVPEQDLNLGNPLTVGYQVAGDALTRRFQNGFVAVNATDRSVMVSIPAAVVSFVNGSAGPRYAAGQDVTLPPHAAILSLTASYLFGSAGHIS